MKGSVVEGDPGSGGGACPRDRCCPNPRKGEPFTSKGFGAPTFERLCDQCPIPSQRPHPLRPSKRLGVVGIFRVLLNYVILMCCIRFGEARHPGPGDFDDNSLVVGTFNATGLLGKGKQVASLPGGIWGSSETHLSKPGLVQFRRELQFCKSTQKFLTNSCAPLTSESLGSVGGRATGVGLLSSYPCRNLPCQWPPSLVESARVHAGAACVGQSWIRVGTFYGYAKCPKNRTTQDKSDALLELLTARIVQESRGFRIICGDFNQPIRALPQTEEWSKMGFVEIQEYAWQKWQRPIEFTSKGAAVRDYVWISPELIPYLESVHTDDTWFADHSLLYAKFRPFDSPTPLPIWKKPAPLPWENCGTLRDTQVDPAIQVHAPDQSSSSCLKAIMQTAEESLDAALKAKQQPGLMFQQRGRACTHDVTWCHHPTTPLKQGSNCDDNPSFTGEHFQHSQWLRQLRRLRSLVRLHRIDPLPSTKIDQAWMLWNSIKNASGFPGGFRAWWPSRAIVHPDTSFVIPRGLPNFHQVQSIYHNFRAEFDHFEENLKKQRAQVGKERRVQDPTQIYRDVARPPAVPVQTLVTTKSCVIEAISSDHLTIHFESAVFDTNEPVFGPLGLLRCLSHSPGCIVLDNDHSLAVGDLLRQQRFCGSVFEVFDEFTNMWQPIWDKHANTPVDSWDSFIAEQVPLVTPPEKSLEVSSISTSEWLQVIQHKKVHTATGPDGISRLDLLNMPLHCTTRLVELINQVECGKPWPDQLMVGLISSLEKKEEAQTAAEYRPICVLSLVYRTWASFRARQLLAWLIQCTPASLIGSRPRKEAADVWFNIASAVEDGHYENLSVSGVSLDIQKCFNMLPRLPVFAIAKHLKLPDRVCVPWFRALMGLQRRFVVRGLTSPALISSSGFPEGDPLSVVAMYLVNLVMTASLAQTCPTVVPWSYVDDWQLVARKYEDALLGYEAICDFTNALQLPLDASKSFFWANSQEGRANLRQGPLPVKLHARNLGGHISYSKISTNFTIVDRIRCCADFWK